MTIADSVWIATALLHRENSQVTDFSVQQIIEKATRSNLVAGYRPGLPVHASKHCVANKPPNPGRHRILVETTRGRRRLFRIGDPFHPDRKDGKTRPEKQNIPAEYHPLIDWYDRVYSRQSKGLPTPPPTTPVPYQFSPNSSSVGTGSESFQHRRSETRFLGPGGTVVLPESLRQELGLNDGSCLSIYRDKDRIVILPITDALLRRLRGSCKGGESLVEARDREHRDERY